MQAVAETAPRELPILFSGPMAREILADNKTQTRRVVNPKLYIELDDGARNGSPVVEQSDPEFGRWCKSFVRCPYGAPGDLLAPRTTWSVAERFDELRPLELPILHPGAIWSEWLAAAGLAKPAHFGKLRPGRFLPRGLWWSVPRLRVTGVRVERVQDISEEDAIAEGVGAAPEDTYACARDEYAALWDSINAKRDGCSWAESPWVWVVEFERVTKGDA